MGLIGLLSGRGEGRRVSPPAAIRIERVTQEASGGMHGVAIFVERAHTSAKTEQHLSCVEGYRHLHGRIDLATLDTSVRKLDCDQPVHHALGPFAQISMAGRRRGSQKSRDNVTRCFRVGCCPAPYQAEVARHSAIGAGGVVLCPGKPVQAGLNDCCCSRVAFWQAPTVAIAFRARCLG
jgi:hypothetical protein